MKTYREPAQDIPVTCETDVIVVGGGPAGLAAAIAAGRNGAKTVLIERFGYLGGTATASLMACINGFRNQVEPDATQVVRGIAEEIVMELKRLGGLGRSPYKQKAYPTEPGQLEYSYAIDVEKFKYVTMRMCQQAGVVMLLHTWFCQPIVAGSAQQAPPCHGEAQRSREAGRVCGVIVENKSGRQALMSRIVIDASGDADVVARAGAPFWQIKKDEAPRLNDGLMYQIQFGQKRPQGTYACDFGTDAVVWGPASGPIDGTDARQLAEAEVQTRLKVYEDFAAQQAKHPELADAKVIQTPPLLGIRQTRFAEGLYKLTADDAIAGRRFDDVVAISPCPIIHYYGYRRYLEHEGYDIPYRCLVPRGIDGLLVAGRCISSEQQPYESHRAMVPIMAIGQAAGVAAALCCGSTMLTTPSLSRGREGYQPKDVSVPALQDLLIRQGAELRLAKGKT